METGISYTRASSRPFSSAVVETTVCEQYRPHLCRHVLSPDLESWRTMTESVSTRQIKLTLRSFLEGGLVTTRMMITMAGQRRWQISETRPVTISEKLPRYDNRHFFDPGKPSRGVPREAR